MKAQELKMGEAAMVNGAGVMYRAAVDRIGAALEPKFKGGDLRGWIDGDGEVRNPPLWKLEAACAKHLRSAAEAFAVLLHSPFAAYGWEHFEVDYPLRTQHHHGKQRASDSAIILAEVRGKAGVALSREILLMARTRRWYRPTRGEEPTTAELRRAA